jgi:hypothetical protein
MDLSTWKNINRLRSVTRLWTLHTACRHIMGELSRLPILKCLSCGSLTFVPGVRHSYAFESYCTSEDPHAPVVNTPEECWSGDVNTNVQWCSIVRTALGDVSMILGGEVDCVKEGAGIQEGLDTSDFIELKTNLVIDSARDEVNFERYVSKSHVQSVARFSVPTVKLICLPFSVPNSFKLLKHYVQSCRSHFTPVRHRISSNADPLLEQCFLAYPPLSSASDRIMAF